MAYKNKQSRTIVLKITEADYDIFMQDLAYAHRYLKSAYQQHPEIFPAGFANGYAFNGKSRKSKKQGIQMRKIKLAGRSYRLRPSFLLPHMRGTTKQVANPLFLLRFGVPFWALAFVFGRNAMYWYRAFLSLSGFSLVGTTIHHQDKLPEDLLADEHHVRVKGQKAYVATTISQGCILGAEACRKADEENLQKGYKVFKQEALQLKADYQPATVNTDGWWATQNAWKTLFSSIFIIECFLHAFLKVRDRATKKLEDYFQQAADKVWEIYRATDKRSMSQRIRRLASWAKKQMPDCPMRENLLKLCSKKKRWLAHLDFPTAYRTSNQLDRIMKAMSRHAFNCQMFHASIKSTSMNFRAFALLYNFSPSCPAVTKRYPGLDSPAARMNGFVYHSDWLQNLMVAASLNGYHQHRNPLQ